MDENVHAKAADLLFPTKGPGRGTGLGLSVVHGLLEGAGGRLVLHSTKGWGTAVEMWFPAAHGARETPPSPRRKPRTAA